MLYGMTEGLDTPLDARCTSGIFRHTSYLIYNNRFPLHSGLNYLLVAYGSTDADFGNPFACVTHRYKQYTNLTINATPTG